MISRRQLLTIPAAFGLGLGSSACHDASIKHPMFGGIVEFSGEGKPRMETALGSELDGRLYTDLGDLTPNSLVTPVSRFYVRTRASKLLRTDKWVIRVRARHRSGSLSLSELRRAAKPLGPRLLECAGNSRGAHFGMISVAEWNGVLVSRILQDFDISAHVLISGFDHYERESRTSNPGAGWIFSSADLRQTGAFFALKMNGTWLTLDHGSPVRLVVPGWYGCCCIKWVNEIIEVDNSIEVTSQMEEYSRRTHQVGTPRFVREYEAPSIDPAAVPVRVERWYVGGRTQYLVTGISWGGMGTPTSLQIRFDRSDEFVPVSTIHSAEAGPWRIWEHLWKPRASGTHEITLRVNEPRVRTRRLDLNYYARTVQVE